MSYKFINAASFNNFKQIKINQFSNNQFLKLKSNKDRRPKPVTPKISIGKERNGY